MSWVDATVLLLIALGTILGCRIGISNFLVRIFSLYCAWLLSGYCLSLGVSFLNGLPIFAIRLILFFLFLLLVGWLAMVLLRLLRGALGCLDHLFGGIIGLVLSTHLLAYALLFWKEHSGAEGFPPPPPSPICERYILPYMRTISPSYLLSL